MSLPAVPGGAQAGQSERLRGVVQVSGVLVQRVQQAAGREVQVREGVEDRVDPAAAAAHLGGVRDQDPEGGGWPVVGRNVQVVEHR
ncbi:hypothetical protein [Deinococcus sp.]|uniref:hypothetical protein n=1 Tax=Deinococcus sp. TaxID=47478 RepID=UPI003918E7C0